MKNSIKTIVIVLGILMVFVFIDTIQAFCFDNSPVLKIREYYNGGDLNYKDKGLFIDTYCGTNGNKDTVIKGFSYSISGGTSDEKYKNNNSTQASNIIKIRDRVKEENLSCDTAFEKFYEDENNEYYFSVIKSHYIIVTYNNGISEDIITALNSGRATIFDLDEFDIDYHIKEKAKM